MTIFELIKLADSFTNQRLTVNTISNPKKEWVHTTELDITGLLIEIIAEKNIQVYDLFGQDEIDSCRKE